MRKQLTAIAAALLLSGCQAAHQAAHEAKTQFYKIAQDPPQQRPDRVNPVPIQSDPALDARNWPVTAAVYPNFSTTAGSAQTMFVARPQKCPYATAFMEDAFFPLDVILIPVAMFKASPTAQVEATSLYLPPTYTANPPLEPVGRENISGGTGIGYTPAIGRAAPFPKADSPK